MNTETLKIIQQNTNVCITMKVTKKFDEILKKKVVNINKFANHDINKFILLLRKNVYPYESMHSQEKFNQTSLQENKIFVAL